MQPLKKSVLGIQQAIRLENISGKARKLPLQEVERMMNRINEVIKCCGDLEGMRAH